MPRSRILAGFAVLAIVFGLCSTILFAQVIEGTPAGGDDIVVNVTGFADGLPMVKKDPIAVPLFKNIGAEPDRMGLSRNLCDQTSEDMRMTGRFDVIDRSMYIENPHVSGVKPGTFDFADWKMIGAEYLIKGSFKLEGDRLTVQFRLYHVPSMKLMVGKEYSGKKDDWYMMVHRFGNDVVYETTRQKGIFGTKIAFVSGQKTPEVWVVDVDGRNKRRLTYLNGKARNPVWSPDGSQIAFAWQSNAVADMNSYLYVIDAVGGQPKEILKVEGLLVSPRFSPSGSRIALAISYNGNMEIYTVRTSGGQPKRLTASRGIELFPAWSPRGDWMAFVSDRSGGPQIWRMRADGSDVQRVSYHGAYNQAPDWAATPNGDRLVYSAREGGGFNIIMTDLSGSEVYNITQEQGFGSCEYPYFSPDGRAIVLTSNNGAGRAIRLFNVDGSYTKLLTRPGSDDKNPSWSPRLLD